MKYPKIMEAAQSIAIAAYQAPPSIPGVQGATLNRAAFASQPLQQQDFKERIKKYRKINPVDPLDNVHYLQPTKQATNMN